MNRKSFVYQKLKKYRYILSHSINDTITYGRKSINAFKFQYKGYAHSPLNLSLLPYPTAWEKLSPHRRLTVEIGTGHGEQLAHLATTDPESLCVGFEITKQFALLSQKKCLGLDNALVFKGEAYSALLNNFSNRSIDRIYILFPDPWHKKRHHKRRPLTTGWFLKVARKLKLGGEILFATDWEEYYQFVESQIESVAVGKLFEIEKGEYQPEKLNLVPTHYYKKWLALERKFQYIKLKKITS